MAKNQGTSPWVWVGCGCASAVLLIIGVVVGAGVFGARALKGYVDEMENPEARQTKILKILGTEALPEGLNAQMFFSVPFLMEMVILSDSPANESGDIETRDLGERALFYMAMRSMGDAGKDLEKLLDGDTSQLNLDVDLDFRSRGDLGRGEFELEGQRIRWASHLGSASGSMEGEGIYTIFLVGCSPDDGKLRMAYYWDRLELPEGTVIEDDRIKDIPLAGTPADEQVLRELTGHFRLCG